jgi:hypothetical protein
VSRSNVRLYVSVSKERQGNRDRVVSVIIIVILNKRILLVGSLSNVSRPFLHTMDNQIENHLPLITSIIVFATKVFPPPPTITSRMEFPFINVEPREDSPIPENGEHLRDRTPYRARTPARETTCARTQAPAMETTRARTPAMEATRARTPSRLPGKQLIPNELCHLGALTQWLLLTRMRMGIPLVH